MKKALMTATVARMINAFNKDNIMILNQLGYKVEVAANFKDTKDDISKKKMDAFVEWLKQTGNLFIHIPITRSIKNLKEIINAYKTIKRLSDENNYDIVHCHSPIASVITRLACRQSRKKGTKVIYTAHGFHFFKGAPKINWLTYYPVELFCSRYTDCIITINKEDYEAALKMKAKKVEYVPGVGVDIDKIRNAAVDRVKLRKELHIDEGDFVILSVGELSKRKNHEAVIRAVANINNDKLKYVICGAGDLENYLKNLSDELGAADRIVFAGYRTDIYEILHVVDMFALPSLQEGLPVALMEAMAAGLPIVCSDIRGNVDLIENGEGGFLCEPCDHKEYEAGIRKILNDPDIRKKMKAVNQEKIKRYDISLIHEAMKKIYQK